MNERKRVNQEVWHINTDGAIRPEQGLSGLAVIVRDEQDHIRYWWKQRSGRLTCNEAEYAAAIFALEQMLRMRFNHGQVVLAVYCDSRVVVDQMSGRAQAHAPEMRKAQARLQALTQRFKRVTFHHIPREQNRLADALAFEAVEGAPRESQPKSNPPNIELWEQFISPWRTP